MEGCQQQSPQTALKWEDETYFRVLKHTKHHSLFLIWGRQNEILADLPISYINCRTFARLLVPTVLGTHRAPAGKAPLICLHTEQQKLRGSGVIELKQSAYKRWRERGWPCNYIWAELHLLFTSKALEVDEKRQCCDRSICRALCATVLWTWRFRPVYLLLNKPCVLASKQIGNASSVPWSAEKGV